MFTQIGLDSMWREAKSGMFFLALMYKSSLILDTKGA
jgi:hypothetical protein